MQKVKPLCDDALYYRLRETDSLEKSMDYVRERMHNAKYRSLLNHLSNLDINEECWLFGEIALSFNSSVAVFNLIRTSPEIRVD